MNGKATTTTAELFAEAEAKLAGAPRIRGGGLPIYSNEWPPLRLQREVVRLNGKKPADADTSNRLLKYAATAKRRCFIANTNYRLLQGPRSGLSLISLGDAALFARVNDDGRAEAALIAVAGLDPVVRSLLETHKNVRG